MRVNIDRLQILLFKIYLIFLPITLFHPLKLDRYFKGIANHTIFIIHILGLLIIGINIYIEKKLKTNNLMTYIAIMIFILNFSSILMSFILNYKLGILYGEDTYRAVFGDIIYYFQLLLIFYYNYYIGNNIEKKYILKAFSIITIYEAVIGYIQIFIVNGIAFLIPLHNMLESIGITKSIDDMVRLGRIYLTGSEPSAIANIVGLIIFPYLLSNILISSRTLYKILIIIYIPIVYFSKSSTVYIISLIQFIIFILMYIKHKKINKLRIVKVIISVLIVAIFGSIYIAITNEDAIKEVRYYLFEKIQDTDNMSTVYRESTVKNNIKVFKKYPLIGIGNGLQGYYYEENLEPYAYESYEVVNVLSGSVGILPGGSFLTSYISGYGLLGIVLFLIFIYKSFKVIKKNNELYYIYIYGGMSFIVLSIMALGITGNYLAIFIASIPLFNKMNTL